MVSLFAPISGDYTSRSAELARQQKLAQMLMEMSQQEMPVSTAGGITAPVSPYGALAKALTSFGGSYLSGKSAADEADLKKSDQEMAQAALKNFYALPDFQQLALSKQPAAPTSFDINVPSLPGQVGPQDVAASVALPGVSRPELATVAGRATTPQEQMQKLAPLMQGGETSRSVYNAFMPQVMQQQAADIKANREDKLPNPVVVDGVLVDGNPKSDTYGQNITQRKAETPKPPSTRTYKSGNTEITEQFNPETGEYERLATSPIRVAGGEGGSSNAKLSPEDLDFMARQALAGDTSVFAGLGYGTTGAANRVALRSKMTQIAKENGMSGGDIAAVNARYFGTKAGERTLGTRSANIGMAVSEAKQLMPLALEASAKVDRTSFPSLNSILIAAAKGTGDPNVVKLGVATNSLINTYARAINPSGVPTVSDKEHARELLENAWSKGQYAAAVAQLKMEMDAAAKSPDVVREEFRNSIPGVSNQFGGNKNYNSASEVANAYKAGKITRDDAAAILKQKGWAE